MKTIQNPQSPRPIPGSGQDQLKALVALYSSGRLNEALSHGTALASRYPNVPLIPNLLGAICARMGRKQEAIAHYRKALALKPDYAEAHNNLGVALNDLDAHDEAIASFSKAIKIKLDYAEAHSNLGNALKSLGRHEEAIASHERAISLKPDFAGAHNNLGNAYRDAERYEEAIASCSRAIKIRPDYSEAHGNLGNAYQDLGRYEEALACYAKAIQIRPNSSEVHVSVASLLVHLGRYEEAIAHYAKAIELKPDNVEAHCGLCGVLESLNRLPEFRAALQSAVGHCPKGDPSVARLSGLLAFREQNFPEAKSILETIEASTLPANEQASLLKLLGQVCDRLGEYETAFRLFRDANEISAKTNAVRRFDGRVFFERIETLIESYAATRARGWGNSQLGNSDRIPVVLVGFPRSGTTLLDTILMGHPKISVIEEKPLVERMLDRLDADQSYERLAALTRDEIQALSGVYLSEEARYSGGRRDADVIIDKHPFDIVNLALVNRVFPRAKIILALRHPCDCVLSCFIQSFRPNAALVNFLDLQNAAALYDRVMTLWQAYEGALSFDRHIVRYEDLVDDFEGTIAPLLEFLGLAWDEKVTSYQETAQGRGRITTPSYRQVTEGLYKRSSGRWINYRREMAPVLPLLEPWIAKWSYD